MKRSFSKQPTQSLIRKLGTENNVFKVLLLTCCCLVFILFIDYLKPNGKRLATNAIPTPTTIQPSPITTSPIPTVAISYDYTPQDWHPDAYMVARTWSNGLNSTGYAESQVYASYKTTDYLIHSYVCCGAYPTGQKVPYQHVFLTKDERAKNEFYKLDGYNDILVISQLNDNLPLTNLQKTITPGFDSPNPVSIDQKNTPMKYINFPFSDENAPKLVNNWPSKNNSVTFNGVTFSADRITLQINNSKTHGDLYNLIFSMNEKTVAIATILSTGQLQSVKAF